MSIRRKIAIVQQSSFNFRSQSAKKDAQESLVAFPIQENALPPAQAANLELKMGGNQFQPSQDFYCSKRVVSLISFCVNPATTCLSPHEAASLAGFEPVESSAVGLAG